jgi:hypothetical protein
MFEHTFPFHYDEPLPQMDVSPPPNHPFDRLTRETQTLKPNAPLKACKDEIMKTMSQYAAVPFEAHPKAPMTYKENQKPNKGPSEPQQRAIPKQTPPRSKATSKPTAAKLSPKDQKAFMDNLRAHFQD